MMTDSRTMDVQNSAANPLRGEATLRLGGRDYLLRPTFAALVAAEAEAGPLFALVERAADGRLGLGEMTAVLWHCLAARPEDLTREAFGEALLAQGLAAALPVFRQLAVAILGGRAP
ncbi:gene transfer agent family protein [Pedomonas sp. V897]|uniref:gene transfer agent family protein n=1 Tax=Pedomonas sp. V897 TaxID=3446482 RepID=UPI003EE0E94D